MSVVRLQVTISTPPISPGAKGPARSYSPPRLLLDNSPTGATDQSASKVNSVHFLTDLIDQSNGRKGAKVLDCARVDRLCSLSIRPCPEAATPVKTDHRHQSPIASFRMIQRASPDPEGSSCVPGNATRGPVHVSFILRIWHPSYLDGRFGSINWGLNA